MARMRKTNPILVLLMLALAGCAAEKSKDDTYNQINAELSQAAGKKASVGGEPDAVAASLLPPISIQPPPAKKPLEERFSLALNNVPAQQFFMAIVAGTRYSMLVHPEVSGSISANLRDVTVFEALDAIREMYGFDYRVEGNRIYVKPAALQTRVFHVNYLAGTRKGTSDIRVTSGSIADSESSNDPNQGQNNNNNNATNSSNAPQTHSLVSSKITTSSDSDFWGDLKMALEAIVGAKDGRGVVVSPESGVIVVRGMWEDQQNVAAYLKAAQLAVDRQVILEAKIMEVQLNDSFQSGINWAAFGNGPNSHVTGGFLSPNASMSPGTIGGATTISSSFPYQDGTSVSLAAVPGNTIAMANDAGIGGLFGLAFQTSNFATLLSFLETQGKVHVLSSPRIATLNNQKAVLKVGTDDYFVTGVTPQSTSAVGNTATTTPPTVTVKPFFSGVALDVTPQIDENDYITLHVHPSVSKVTTNTTSVNLGTSATNASLVLPLPSSAISETDSIVRGLDGHVIAIGGLMRQETISDRSQIPGAGDVPVAGALFRNKTQLTQKRELVILLKPTIVKDGSEWAQDIVDAQRRVQGIGTGKDR